MAMNWTSLTAAKGVTGSVATWVSYTKLDLPTIVDEAQALLYETLRVREMMTETVFRMVTGNSEAPLPARFLDPISKIYSPTLNVAITHKDEGFLLKSRVYTTLTGSLGAAPFTTTLGSAMVAVNFANHGFYQGGLYTGTGATAVGGLTPNGTFPIASITDANNFVIDTSSLGTVATSNASGGGAVATFSCDNLTLGYPTYWAVWAEKIKFDGYFPQDATCQLLYYQSLPLLSASNLNNFLTDRYPNLMRQACVTAAADFMKDATEYQKGMSALGVLIQRINSENEGFRRGSEIDTETP